MNMMPMGPPGSAFAREFVIGFGPQGPFQSGERFVIKKQLRDAIKKDGMFFGQRLIVPSTIAKFFNIEGIFCDEQDAMPVPAAIPALVFSEDAMGVKLGLEPVANHFTLHVVRNEVKPHSWLVRLVRRWLGFPHDPAKPEFSACILGELVPHDEVEAKRKMMAMPMIPNQPSASAEDPRARH